MNQMNLPMLTGSQLDRVLYEIGGVDVGIAVANGIRPVEPAKQEVQSLEPVKPVLNTRFGNFDDFPENLISSLILNLGGLAECHAIASGARLVQTAGRVLINGCNFNPHVHLGQPDWSLIIEKTDYNAANLKTLNFHEFGVQFEHCLDLSDDSGFITGFEKYDRLKKSGHVLLGTGALLALWNEPGHETLKVLHSRNLKQLDFFGDILLSPMNNECVATLQADQNGKWSIVCRNLSLQFGRKMYAAIIRRGNSSR